MQPLKKPPLPGRDIYGKYLLYNKKEVRNSMENYDPYFWEIVSSLCWHSHPHAPRKKTEQVDIMLILGSGIMSQFWFFFVLLCTFYSFYNEFIPFAIRRNSRAKVNPVSRQRKHFACPSLFLALGFGTMLSSVALLSILVFIPSAVVVVLLLVRMARKSAGLKKRSKSGYKKSSIEVSDE